MEALSRLAYLAELSTTTSPSAEPQHRVDVDAVVDSGAHNPMRLDRTLEFFRGSRPLPGPSPHPSPYLSQDHPIASAFPTPFEEASEDDVVLLGRLGVRFVRPNSIITTCLWEHASRCFPRGNLPFWCQPLGCLPLNDVTSLVISPSFFFRGLMLVGEIRNPDRARETLCA